MKRYLHFETVLLVTAAVLTAVITCLRVLALALGYDSDAGYYTSGNGFRIAADILTGLYVAAALTISILSCFGKLTPTGDPPQARYSALVLGAVFVFFIAFRLMRGHIPDAAGICLLVATVFLIGGAAYCVLTYLQLTRMSAVRAICAMCAVCFGLFYAIHYYFLKALPVNGNLKTQHILAAVALFMFFLTEAQRALGRGKGIKERFFALVCFMFSLSVSIPEFYACFFRKDAVFEDFSHPLLLLAVGLYALTRLSVTRQSVPRPAKTEVRLTDELTDGIVDVDDVMTDEK